MANIPDKQARQWAMAAHLSALSLFIGIPFGNILGPLVIWLLKKDDHALIDKTGKESLNFQLSMLVYSICAGILVLIFIGVLLLIAVAVVDVVLVIIASVKVSNGEDYSYPITIQFIK